MPRSAARNRKAATRPSSTVIARLRALESQVEQNRRELELQFRRMSQMQAELDHMKEAWAKLNRVQ